jgi:hypothetical protein
MNKDNYYSTRKEAEDICRQYCYETGEEVIAMWYPDGFCQFPWKMEEWLLEKEKSL